MDLECSIFGAQRSFNALGAQNNGVQKLRRRKRGVIIFNFFPSASKHKLPEKNHENLALGAQKAPQGAIFLG